MSSPPEINKRSLWSKAKSFLGLEEGSWRGPFYGQGELDGWYELGNLEDGYQRGLELPSGGSRKIPAAYAAVMANARAISQCSPLLKRKKADGEIEIIKSGPVAKILKNPNEYETWSQFIINIVAENLFEGQGTALAIRNGRNDITALHRCCGKSVMPYIGEDSSIFYTVGSNPMLPARQDFLIPARDCLTIRSHCPRHPLLGESSIKAAALAAGINVALSQSQAAFFRRMSRPSGIISSDLQLNESQMASLRAAWEKQTTMMQAGGIPILANGMKFQNLGISSQDAQLIEAQRLSIEDIARVFGVPLPIIGDMTNSTLSNVEQMVSLWLSISLGSLMQNIETSLDKLFNLPDDVFIEFDVGCLLRTDFTGRIDGLSKGVQNGLFTPNEARSREGLSPVDHGDKIYMQRQMVELGNNPDAMNNQEQETTPENTQEDQSEQEADIEDDEESKAIVKAAIKRVMTL